MENLFLEQTVYGKTTFIQNLAKSRLFGKMKDITWLTKITLSKKREENIRSCFDTAVNFTYLQNISKFYI